MTSTNLLETAAVAQAIVDALPCCIVDARDRITEANAAFATRLNRPASLLVGVEILELMRGLSVDESYSTGAPCFHLRADETESWVRLDRMPVMSGREMVRLVDVSAEWLALTSVVTARTVRDRLMADAEVGIWRYDPDTRLSHFFSESALDRDHTSDPVSIETLQRIQHPDDVSKYAAICARLTTEGGSAEGEMRYRDVNSEWKTIRVHYRSGRKMPSGRYEMFGISQNVGELARARDEADMVKHRLELAMGAAKIGVYEIDLQTGDRWSSEQFKEIAGEEGMARQDAHPFGIYMDEEQKAVRESWDRCLASDGVESIDTRIYRPDGKGRWMRLFTRVHRNANGQNTRAVGLMMDIHDQKEQELALVDAKVQAEVATLAKSNFLASISHEIRTPLNGILGMAQVLNNDPLTEAQKGRISIISESGQTLMALLDDVLDISKIDAGKMEIALVDGDLRQTLEHVRQLFLSRAEERGLQLSLEVDDSVPARLRYDPVRVRQCFGNLLSNGIKFTEQGGVKVRVSAQEQHTGEWRICIAVIDTGIGMDLDTRSNLFLPFLQGDASVSRRFGGTGLGLAITRQLARLMGGDVIVDSVPGIGSTFSLLLMASASEKPVVEPIETPASPVEQMAERSMKRVLNARVLLVDDNPVNRHVVRLFMAQFLPQFVEAVNGEEALARLHEQPFDIVLLDVHMPVMDGKETIKRIRASDAPWRDIPVIALTADAMSGDKERYMALGMSDYISKPIDARELATKYITLLQGSPLAARHAA
jgi:PAS domain S-box-containing protein